MHIELQSQFQRNGHQKKDTQSSTFWTVTLMVFSFENVVALQSQHTESTGVSLSVIVSIGYEQEDVFPPQRVYDFTPKSEVVNLPEYPPGVPWPILWRSRAFFRNIKRSERNRSTNA